MSYQFVEASSNVHNKPTYMKFIDDYQHFLNYLNFCFIKLTFVEKVMKKKYQQIFYKTIFIRAGFE